MKRHLFKVELSTLLLCSFTLFPSLIGYSQNKEISPSIQMAQGTRQEKTNQYLEKEIRIEGIVVDEHGEPLPGAAIIVKGTKNAVVSDVNGHFSIKANPRIKGQVILEYSFIGMETKTLAYTQSASGVKIVLKNDSVLDEVIVQGYGRVQNREDLVGSAFQVGSAELDLKPVARIDKLLDGMVPGLRMEANTDAPGSTRTRYTTRIRGEASLSASNEPLWIVDGVPVFTGSGTNIIPGMSYSVSPLSFINSDDIASITVLKDASEVSIYGADGANGVILVTTKTGKLNREELRINANFRYGISNIDESTRFKTLNAAQYMAYAKQAWVNGGEDIALFPYQDNPHNSYSTTDTDWHKLYYGVGQNALANVSLTSSGKKSATYFSASYYNDKSTVKGNTQERFSARLNSTYKFGEHLTVKPSISASYNVNDIFSPSHEYYKILPIFSLYDTDGYTYRLLNTFVDGRDEDGNLIWKRSKFYKNSIVQRALNQNEQKTFSTDGNLLCQYEIIKGLTATAQFGVSYQHSYEKRYDSRKSLQGIIGKVPKGYSKRSSANFISWTNIDRLNFNRKFGKHAINALAGIELSSKGYNTLYASGYGFLNDKIQEVGYSEEATRTGYSSTRTTRKCSFLAQAGYTFDSRYSIQFNMRREGNSSFGKYARWANYFSSGLAWNIHNESFFNAEGLVKMLKLKASFGTSGNSRVDSAQMRGLGLFTYGEKYSYNGEIGGVISTPANPGISWETTYMSNIGLDMRLGEYVDIAVETYYNYTKNLLSKMYTSRVIGDQRIYGNVGEISNRGIEFTLRTTNFNRENFGWTTNFNISHNRNKVEKLADGKSITYFSTITAEGHDVSSFYLVRWAGVDPTNGAPMWYDKNGNLTYSYSTADRIIRHSSTPSAYGSLTNSFRIGDFNLSFLINYTLGGHALCSIGTNAITDGYDIINQNVSINSLDYWKQPGDVSPNPRISTISSDSGRASTRFLYSKTNVKLQNFSLSYNLPQNIVKKLAMSSVRLSMIADNLYLWTPDQKRYKNSYKTMMSGYPVQRTVSFSLDMSF